MVEKMVRKEELRESLFQAAQTLPLSELPAFMGTIEQAKAIALGRMCAVATTQAAVPEEWLSVSETAKLLGMSADFVYRRATELGVSRVGRNLRFSRREVEKRLQRSRE